MNDTLSTFIAFAGFLAVFSALVTSVQESLKNILKLKAGVWDSFFTKIYKEQFGSKKKQKKLLDILPNYFSRNHIGEFDKRLERLAKMIRIADQSLGELKNNIDSLDFTKKLSRKDLSDTVKKARYIKRLSLDNLLSIFDQYGESNLGELQSNIIALDNIFKELSSKIPATDLKEIETLCNKIQAIVTATLPEISEYKLKLELKADAWLEQINHHFKRKMHIWTIGIGLLMTVMFNADAFEIYRHLKINPELKATLIELAKTEQASGEENNLFSVSPDEINTIKESLSKIKIKSMNKPDELHRIQEKMIRSLKELTEDYKQFNISDKPLGALSKTLKAARKEVDAKFNNTAKDTSKPLKAYLKQLKSSYSQLAVQYVSFHRDSVREQIRTLADTALPLGWTDDLKDIKMIGCSFKLFDYFFPKIGGLLLTSFLVTFGAPFWRDVLSALAGLKSSGIKKPAA